MLSLINYPYLWISFFLVICAGYDFYSSRIPNKFILISLGISIFSLVFFLPLNVWFVSVQSFVIMFLVGFVLFKFKVLGGGDIKALCIVSLFLAPNQLQDFLTYSILWGGAYAFIFYMISGQIFKVLYNTIGVYQRFTTANTKMPFTFGILLGWFSLFTVGVLSW